MEWDKSDFAQAAGLLWLVTYAIGHTPTVNHLGRCLGEIIAVTHR